MFSFCPGSEVAASDSEKLSCFLCVAIQEIRRQYQVNHHSRMSRHMIFLGLMRLLILVPCPCLVRSMTLILGGGVCIILLLFGIVIYFIELVIDLWGSTCWEQTSSLFGPLFAGWFVDWSPWKDVFLSRSGTAIQGLWPSIILIILYCL